MAELYVTDIPAADVERLEKIKPTAVFTDRRREGSCMIRIEKTKFGNYTLKIKNREIALDAEEFEKLRIEVQKAHYTPDVLKALKDDGFDTVGIKSDSQLLDTLCDEYVAAIEDGYNFMNDIDASEIIYGLEREYKSALAKYQIDEED